MEDDAALVDGLRYALSKNGYEIEVAGSVREAKERLKEKFDLLLLDVALPDGTGYEICREVRGKDSRIPIIFLTAADDEMSIVRGLDGGGDDYGQDAKAGNLLDAVEFISGQCIRNCRK